MLHRWADRSQGKRLVSIPTLMLVTATTTVSVAFLGTTAAEASTSPMTSLVAAPANLTVGQSTQLTATISRAPAFLGDTDVVVSFTIVSGGNAGTSIPNCVIPALLVLAGTSCTTSYSGTQSGTDTIQASAGAGTTSATVTWQGIPSSIVMSPAVSYNSTGQTANVAATVFDRQGKPVQGATVAFTVTGPGAISGSHPTDNSGVAPFSFSSSAPGQSSIIASVAVGSGSITGHALANWAGPPSQVTLSLFGATQSAGGRAPLNGNATVAAAVTDSGGIPVGDNTVVNFTVTGAGSTTGSAPTSEGKAVFPFGSAVTGTSVVTASAPPAPTSNSVTVTWETPVAKTVTLAPKQTRAAVGTNHIVVATVTDQFGQPFPGALVRFILLGANAAKTTSSFTTLADGKAAFLDRGQNVGIDTIIAFVDLQNSGTPDPGDPADTANIFWQQPPGQGYWLAASDGGIFNYGPSTSFEGSTGSIRLNQPIVGMARTPTGFGYWLVASDGGIFAFGDAVFRGSTGSTRLNKPIVGMAATPDGGGYWLAASDGGIFAFGDAVFQGSTGTMHLNQPIVGMASSPDGGGYWLVATDGGVFAFGNAAFQGSTGSTRLNKPIVGMAATSSGAGYWMAASDGGIFNFGDAAFFGSAGSIRLNQPVVAIGAIPDGSGYYLAASDGGVFNFPPSATNFGSAAGAPLNKPVVTMAIAP
ncbi:MAG: hypothetical protein QOJ93_977 [Actinomycetota bacterium]|nr:hypothetical protein [Actinomycetota bacterium]